MSTSSEQALLGGAREVDLDGPARLVIAAYGAYRRVRQTALRDLYAEVVGAKMTLTPPSR